MTNGKRDYKKEVAKYTSRPEVIRKRVEQNKARRMMEKAGKVHKGDGKDVDHTKPLSKGGKTTPGNRKNSKKQIIAKTYLFELFARNIRKSWIIWLAIT